MDELQELIHTAHESGLKIVLAVPLPQVSVRHPWFQASQRSRQHGTKSTWFVWSDPKPDGSPPTNWITERNNSAWQWDPLRQQYYLHRGSPEYAALNLTDPVVQSTLIKRVQLLLNRGIDGVLVERVDALVHDPFLQDNPPAPPVRS